jgi:4-hydroxy-tetrahydrodipicolinate synthase
MTQPDLLPQGVWPVMLTPFTDNNHLDLPGLRRLTDFYLAAGVSGLFANCLSSEMFQLSEQERLEVVRTVVDQTQDRVPVVATGTFTQDPDQAADFIKKVHDLGVVAVITISGVLADPDEDEGVLQRRLEQIMERTGDIPLGLYECPVPYKRLVSPALMGWLAKSGRFRYHKDTSCHSGAIRQKLAAIEGSPFSLFNADTPTAIGSLQDGARGISPISANYYPELFTYLFTRFRKSGLDDELQYFYTQLIILDKLNHGFYPYAAKVFLQKRGLGISTVTRIPTEVMTAADQLRLQAVYDVFQRLAQGHGVASAFQVM